MAGQESPARHEDPPVPLRRDISTVSLPPNLTGLTRRTSSQRINDILETAKDRADAMRSGSNSPGAVRSGHSPRFEPIAQHPDGDSSADETTHISTRGDRRTYQGTQTSSTTRHRGPNTAQAQPQSSQTQAEGQSVGEKRWLQEYLGSLWSIELENKGSVARDHLALERTFLAWLRTSLSFASIGIAITQLFRLNTTLTDTKGQPTGSIIQNLGRPLGATFLGISILVLFLGYHRYYESQQFVLKGKFPASRGTIVLVSLVGLALMLLSLVIVIIVQPAT